MLWLLENKGGAKERVIILFLFFLCHNFVKFFEGSINTPVDIHIFLQNISVHKISVYYLHAAVFRFTRDISPCCCNILGKEPGLATTRGKNWRFLWPTIARLRRADDTNFLQLLPTILYVNCKYIYSIFMIFNKCLAFFSLTFIKCSTIIIKWFIFLFHYKFYTE